MKFSNRKTSKLLQITQQLAKDIRDKIFGKGTVMFDHRSDLEVLDSLNQAEKDGKTYVNWVSDEIRLEVMDRKIHGNSNDDVKFTEELVSRADKYWDKCPFLSDPIPTIPQDKAAMTRTENAAIASR